MEAELTQKYQFYLSLIYFVCIFIHTFFPTFILKRLLVEVLQLFHYKITFEGEGLFQKKSGYNIRVHHIRVSFVCMCLRHKNFIDLKEDLLYIEFPLSNSSLFHLSCTPDSPRGFKTVEGRGATCHLILNRVPPGADIWRTCTQLHKINL